MKSKLRSVIAGHLLTLVLALAAPPVAFAQCSGQAPPNTFCGNSSGAQALPKFLSIPPSSLAPVAGGTVLGNPTAITAVPTATASPVLGVPGASTGRIGFSGATSGTVTLAPQGAAGTYNFNLPTSAGTAGGPLLSGGGGSSPQTYGTRLGNTTTFATVNGALVAGHYVTSDASGNLIDGGVAPGVCPLGYTCVSQYANLAAAVAALGSGGTLYFDQSVTISSAQVIAVNVHILCANKTVTIGTTSTTADILTVTGASNVTVEQCRFDFVGTPGTRTAGSWITFNGGSNGTVNDVVLGPLCATACLNFVNISVFNLSNIISEPNIGNAPAAGSSIIRCAGGILHIVNLAIGGADIVAHQYPFGLDMPECALGLSTFEILAVRNAIRFSPSAGQTTFAFISSGFFDTISETCVLMQPSGSGAVVGYVSIHNTECGADGNGINIDTASGGGLGTVGDIILTGNNWLQYTANSGSAVSYAGTIGGQQMITGNNFCLSATKWIQGLVANVGSSFTNGITVMGNSFCGNTASITVSPAITNCIIQLNRNNGGAVVNAGASPCVTNNF